MSKAFLTCFKFFNGVTLDTLNFLALVYKNSGGISLNLVSIYGQLLSSTTPCSFNNLTPVSIEAPLSVSRGLLSFFHYNIKIKGLIEHKVVFYFLTIKTL